MSSDIPTRLFEAERNFRRACDQVSALNRAIQQCQERYDHAGREQIRMFRYSHRLRMAVTEGVRNMFYEYATIKADEITELRSQIGSDDELSDSEVGSDYSYDCDSEDGISPNYNEDTETDDTVLTFQSLSTSDAEFNEFRTTENRVDSPSSSDSSIDSSSNNQSIDSTSSDSSSHEKMIGNSDC